MSGKNIVDLELLKKLADNFFATTPIRTIPAEIALSPDVIGMEIYDSPIFGIASADDPLFETLKKSDVIGDHFLMPKEWMPEARAIIREPLI